MATQPCSNLRTKKSYVPAFDDDDVYSSEETNAQFFCLKTLLQTGVDDGSVCPESCTSSRSCYEPLSPLA
jgi:hypothetical protein